MKLQVIFKNIREDFKKYNIISKYILKIGTIILIGLITFAISVWVYISYVNPDCTVQLFFEDLLECIKESFGSIYLSAFVLEIFNRLKG